MIKNYLPNIQITVPVSKNLFILENQVTSSLPPSNQVQNQRQKMQMSRSIP